MALEFTKLPRPDDQPAAVVVAVDRLWLDASKKHLLHDGHPDAAFLFCVPGDEIRVAEAGRVGLLKGSSAKAEAEAEPQEESEPAESEAPAEAEQEPEAKQDEPAEDKKAAKPADKRRRLPSRRKKN